MMEKEGFFEIAGALLGWIEDIGRWLEARAEEAGLGGWDERLSRVFDEVMKARVDMINGRSPELGE